MYLSVQNCKKHNLIEGYKNARKTAYESFRYTPESAKGTHHRKVHLQPQGLNWQPFKPKHRIRLQSVSKVMESAAIEALVGKM